MQIQTANSWTTDREDDEVAARRHSINNKFTVYEDCRISKQTNG
jgi:hypothetical protein